MLQVCRPLLERSRSVEEVMKQYDIRLALMEESLRVARAEFSDNSMNMQQALRRLENNTSARLASIQDPVELRALVLKGLDSHIAHQAHNAFLSLEVVIGIVYY